MFLTSGFLISYGKKTRTQKLRELKFTELKNFLFYKIPKLGTKIILDSYRIKFVTIYVFFNNKLYI